MFKSTIHHINNHLSLGISHLISTSDLMFYSSPDEDIPFFRPLEPRLFFPSPEEQPSYLESQTQEFSKPTSTALQSPKTTLTTSSSISFPPFNQPTMFSRLRKIICGTATSSPIGTGPNIKTIYPNSQGIYTITKTSLPSPPPSISCGEEDRTIMSSTCTSLRRSSRPRLTISILESNITGRTFAVQNQQVNICSHTRKVHWSDPLIVAVFRQPTYSCRHPTNFISSEMGQSSHHKSLSRTTSPEFTSCYGRCQIELE